MEDKDFITYATYHEHLRDAFKKDIEDFVKEFEKLCSFSYDSFVQVWHKSNFSYVFAEQRHASVLTEFCENIFFITKKYLVFQESLYVKVCSLFMLYALYYKQPVKCWVKIRLTLSDFKKIVDLIEHMRAMKELDVLYCYSKLKLDNAFVYVYQPQKLGLDGHFFKSHHKFTDDTFKEKNEESSIEKLKEIMANPTYQDFLKTNEEYEKSMQEFSKKNPSMTVFRSNAVKSFQEAYDNIYLNNVVIGNAEGEMVRKRNELPIETCRQKVIEKAVSNMNATYRGLRKVPTAVDSTDSSINKAGPSGTTKKVTKRKRGRKKIIVDDSD